MINRGNHILILLNLYCCSKQKLSKILIMNVANLTCLATLILIQNIIQAFCVFYLYTLYMIGLPQERIKGTEKASSIHTLSYLDYHDYGTQ